MSEPLLVAAAAAQHTKEIRFGTLATQVEESGDGVAILIYGGNGGIRIKPLEDETEWGLEATKQKGITHLVYPRDCFIVYKDEI